MKKWILATCLIMAGNVFADYKPEPRTGKRAKKRMYSIESLLKKFPNPDVLLLGDSITNGWRFTSAASDFPQKLKIVNAGVDGDGIQHLLWRMQRSAYQVVKPKMVFVTIGANNIYIHEKDRIVEGIQRTIHLAKTNWPEATLVLNALTPVRGTFEMKSKVAAINDTLRAYAKQRKIAYVDIESPLRGMSNEYLRKFLKDKLHLTDSGYKLWASALIPQMEAVLR